MEHGGENFALVVDEVGDVIVLDGKTRIPCRRTSDQQRAKLTEAVYRLDDGILPQLDMSAIFDFPRQRTMNKNDGRGVQGGVQ